MGYTFLHFAGEVQMPWKASSVMEDRLRFERPGQGLALERQF